MQSKTGLATDGTTKSRLAPVVFWGLLPIVGVVLLFVLLYCSVGSGITILDVNRWPAVMLSHCASRASSCDRPSHLEVVLRIVAVCGASFTLFNKPSQFGVLMRVAREFDSRGFVDWMTWLVYFSGIANAAWVVVLYFEPSAIGVTFEAIVTILMFAIFCVADVGFMVLHSTSAKYSDRIEFNYFFGNTFYIDVPTLFGLVIVWSLADGLAPQALADGGLVMHVVFSQIVFAFLQVQLGFNRRRPAFQS
jgi:hypothetical protein